MISYKHSISFKNLINKKSNNIYDYLPKSKYHFTTSSGRGGLEVCIKLLKLSTEDYVLIPAFVPQGVISPFLKKKINIDFFHSNKNLIIDLELLEKKIISNNKIKVLVIIHYYGFPQPINEIKTICKKHNIILIEDCAHTLYSKDKNGKLLGSTGDISFFSIGKIFPSPDGAFFLINNQNINFDQNLIKYNFSIFYSVSILSHFINLLLNSWQSKIKNRTIYKITDFFLSLIYATYYYCLKFMKKPANISNISKRLINNINLGSEIQKIQKNSKIFYENINQNKYNLVYKEYNENFVLMGIPLLVKNRDEFCKKLYEKDIMCAYFKYFWDFIPENQRKDFPNEIYYLKHHVMVPVNEKITEEEMYYIVNVINSL